VDPITQLLRDFAVAIASQTVFDFVKGLLWKGSLGQSELATKLSEEFPSLSVENAEVLAGTVVEFFAQRGDITIKDTRIYAEDSVWMRSARGTKLSLTDSSTQTSRTRIDVTRGSIQAQGGAEVRQNPNGSISFRT